MANWAKFDGWNPLTLRQSKSKFAGNQMDISSSIQDGAPKRDVNVGL